MLFTAMNVNAGFEETQNLMEVADELKENPKDTEVLVQLDEEAIKNASSCATDSIPHSQEKSFKKHFCIATTCGCLLACGYLSSLGAAATGMMLLVLHEVDKVPMYVSAPLMGGGMLLFAAGTLCIVGTASAISPRTQSTSEP